MSKFRQALHFSESQLSHVNGNGELEGPIGPVMYEAFIYLYSKVNLSWIPPDGGLTTTSEIVTRGAEMLSLDQADGIFSVFPLNHGLLNNVTASQVILEESCKLVSSPVVDSVVIQDGPESALRKINSSLLLVIFIGLFFMIISSRRRTQWNITSSLWILFTVLSRQNIIKVLKRLPMLVLIVSTLLIQTLFGSFLHTERTSIRKFVKIDSLLDVRKYNATTFVLPISSCPKLIGGDHSFQVIPIDDEFSLNGGWTGCEGSGECASLMNSLDLNLFLSTMCSIHLQRALRGAFYVSPALSHSLGGFLFNKRIAEAQRNRLNGYIQRSFEMGLEQKKGLIAKDFSTRIIKQVAQMDPNEECFSKKVENSLSTPVALKNEFFKNCFILYFLVILASLILYARTLWKC